MKVSRSAIYIRGRRPGRSLMWLASMMIVLAGIGVCIVLANSRPIQSSLHVSTIPVNAVARPGDVLGVDSVLDYTKAETSALVHENYGAASPPVGTGITKITFHYRSKAPDGEAIIIYARAYLPATPATNLPVFAFAPGTTGIGDRCAASLEQPKVSNWANYDSHLAAYASQGFAGVTTDYEGMRDLGRIHHYMVGELEGRAVLDSVRALRKLPQTQDRLSAAGVFLGGYSQGGHAAFWADKIAASYAPDVSVAGVVGFGPVMSVKQTLSDVTRGANINWFGPDVLFSYGDYYRTKYSSVLLPHWQETLSTDVPAHCIDTDIAYWGHNPAAVYTPEFMNVLATGHWADTPFAQLGEQLDRNEVGLDATASAKRINSGALDNVVLPSQQDAAYPLLCTSSHGPVQLVKYPHATHYTTMIQSLSDTLAWMRQIAGGGQVEPTCPVPVAPR